MLFTFRWPWLLYWPCVSPCRSTVNKVEAGHSTMTPSQRHLTPMKGQGLSRLKMASRVWLSAAMRRRVLPGSAKSSTDRTCSSRWKELWEAVKGVSAARNHSYSQPLCVNNLCYCMSSLFYCEYSLFVLQWPRNLCKGEQLPLFWQPLLSPQVTLQVF